MGERVLRMHPPKVRRGERIEMVRKKPVGPRAAQSTGKTDVAPRITAEAISQRAYNIFEAHGCEHGHDVEHWLAAEAELSRATTH